MSGGKVMNMPLLIGIIFVLVIIAIVWTFIVFKQEENKMKKYEEEGDTVADEIRRSHEYETSSRSNVSLQILIYTVTIVLSLVIFGIYIF